MNITEVITEQDQPELPNDQIVEWGEFVDADQRWREAAPWALTEGAVYAYPRHRNDSRLTCYRGHIIGVGHIVGGPQGVALIMVLSNPETGMPENYAIRLGSIARIEPWNPETSENHGGIDENFAL